jgi:5-formyltetrahydrofolate cyclo-ligase
LEQELAEGPFGIREPLASVRTGEAPVPDLVLAPGLVFDLRGGRLGRGKGFYDRYLAGFRGFKAGLAYDVQFMGKNLPLDAHDQTMDAVVTDQRTQVFAAPRIEAV